MNVRILVFSLAGAGPRAESADSVLALSTRRLPNESNH